MSGHGNQDSDFFNNRPKPAATPTEGMTEAESTAPVLTDAEISQAINGSWRFESSPFPVARAVEAALLAHARLRPAVPLSDEREALAELVACADAGLPLARSAAAWKQARALLAGSASIADKAKNHD